MDKVAAISDFFKVVKVVGMSLFRRSWFLKRSGLGTYYDEPDDQVWLPANTKGRHSPYTGSRLRLFSPEEIEKNLLFTFLAKTSSEPGQPQGILETSHISIWNLEQSIRELLLEGHRRGVSTVAFNQDGSRLVSASYDGTFILWDLVIGQEWSHISR
jgi:WD40 repeat protein